MQDISSLNSAREQLEQLITTLVNAWLQQQKESTYNNVDKQEMMIKQFCNLSLQALYQILFNNLLMEPDAGATHPITPEMVQRCLQAGDYTQLGKSYIPDDFMDKTNIMQWMQQKEREGKILSVRLFTVLDDNAKKWECIEYITKQSFLRCRGAGENTWKEFVTLRGY